MALLKPAVAYVNVVLPESKAVCARAFAVLAWSKAACAKTFAKLALLKPAVAYVNVELPESYASGPFANFNLTATSIGKNYGTDGTDVGIYGGSTPFVEGATTDSRFRYFPKPAIPQMLDMTLNNPNIPANGTLSVNFSASKQD